MHRHTCTRKQAFKYIYTCTSTHTRTHGYKCIHIYACSHIHTTKRILKLTFTTLPPLQAKLEGNSYLKLGGIISNINPKE